MTMPSRRRVILAVFKRNFFAYFINPTGYVFITVFILLGAIAAFWPTSFFLNNLANLDALNAWFPVLLLFFVPALTMNVWSEERRQGTDELLFTLPGRDVDIVLGKYLAVLGIYTVAVLFSLSHLVILVWLGEPDLGLMLATYLGYWLTGAALLSVGMVASLLTGNATVAFIIGAVLCAALVFVDGAESVLGGWAGDLVRTIGVRSHFEAMAGGVVPVSAIVYFAALTGIMLYVNVAILGRRHIAGDGAASRVAHLGVRAAALAVASVSFLMLVDRAGANVDVTAERLHTLQPQTRAIIDAVPADRPVFIQAYFSPEMPEAFVRTRKDLVNALQRLDDVGGDRLQVVIHDTEPYGETAARAAESFDIRARRVTTVEASQRSSEEVFLGLVFTSGPEEFVIPFFDRGLPVEYELARSVRVVSQADRRRIGVVATDANLFGGFDFQSGSSSPEWSIVGELRKQYEVVQVAADGPVPADLDALLAVLPSSLTQPQLDILRGAILAGTPTLVFDDPLPMFNAQLSPSLPKDAMRNPFTSQGQPPAPPKGDFDALLADLGLRWQRTGVGWADDNPHPAIADAPPEIVFVNRSPRNATPFNEASPITAGLQEVVVLYPGMVTAELAPAGGVTITPLLRSALPAGITPWENIIQRSFFGMQVNPNPRRMIMVPEAPLSLAMHVTGTPPGAAEGAPPVNVVMVADVDAISETFFDLRRQGFEGLQFDNVSFALNCIDVLAGDESFVELRKHRSRHRTLTRVEELSTVYTERRQAETDAAEQAADEQLAEAQARLDRKVAELEARADLDRQTRQIMLNNLESVENRRLDVVESNIEQEKQRALDRARTETARAIAGIQRRIKWWAAVIPPIPTLLLAIGLFAYRHQRERVGISERRLVEARTEATS